MKITNIANACCVYEHEGYKILTDPWLIDPAFDSWVHVPPLKSKPSDFFDVDLVYISHGHPDHFDVETLRLFPKNKKILIYDSKSRFMERALRELGFKHIVVLQDKEYIWFGPFSITMLGPLTPHPFFESKIGNLIDSGIILQCAGFKIANLNDNTPDRKSAEFLGRVYGEFDLVQLVDSCAGPFPAAFMDLTHERKIDYRDGILRRHLDLMFECAKLMKAKRMMPWAGHYQLCKELEHLNQYLAVISPEDMAKEIEQAGIPSLYLKEGESFQFDAKNAFYDAFEEPTEAQLQAGLKSALKRLRAKQEELNCFPDSLVCIAEEGRMDNPLFQFYLNKSSPEEQRKCIYFAMNKKLLWAILNKKRHWNNMEIGCHISIARNQDYNPDIHLLMSFFHI